MDDTLLYYNKNADKFINDTAGVQFDETQDRFLKYLQPGASILDFGCGSGRDTLAFLQQGYEVEAIDGSSEMCFAAQRLCGISVSNLLFNELSAVNKYDGIWACASILHVPKSELSDIFHKMYKALKDNGIVYCSFKHGNFEGMRDGRFYTDFNEIDFRCFISSVPGFEIKEVWISSDVREGRSNEKWINIILRK